MPLRTGLAALALILFGAAAASADVPRWAVVPKDSRLSFTATQLGAPFDGVFKAFEATIVFDPANPDANVADVSIDVASVDTAQADRDAQVRGVEWFDVSSHPDARFKTTAFRTVGAGWEVDAVLTIKGVSRKVTLPFTLKLEGNRAFMEGTVTIDRRDFNVGTGQWLGPDSAVGNEVIVQVSIVADRI